MNVIMYANTNGSGYWSEISREIKINKLTIGFVNDSDTLKNCFAELRAYFNVSSWKYNNKKYPGWNTNTQGLIYTDDNWIKEFRNGLIELGISKKSANTIGYTEQGMQGSNYVSMDVGGSALLELYNFGVDINGNSYCSKSESKKILNKFNK